MGVPAGFDEVMLDRVSKQTYSLPPVGGCSSAWLEPQIVDLVVAGSNPVSHPTPCLLWNTAFPEQQSKMPPKPVDTWGFRSLSVISEITLPPLR